MLSESEGIRFWKLALPAAAVFIGILFAYQYGEPDKPLHQGSQAAEAHASGQGK